MDQSRIENLTFATTDLAGFFNYAVVSFDRDMSAFTIEVDEKIETVERSIPRLESFYELERGTLQAVDERTIEWPGVR